MALKGKDRTAISRELNDVLGIVGTSITIPREDREYFLEEAAIARAEHMMRIAEGKDLEALEALARKRSVFNMSNDQRRQIDMMTNVEGREEVRQLMFEYQKLKLNLEKALTDPEEIGKIMRMRARINAVGFSIAAKARL